MTILPFKAARAWTYLAPKFLPFADAATPDLPLARLMRLSLFQISVGMTAVLQVGTLNRVMIVELGVPAALVAVMVGLPLLFAPLRALLGFRSDTHKSYLGWRRIPYIWFGSLIQFGGLAIMPFALLVMSEGSHAQVLMGQIAVGLAFLLASVGMYTVQTAGLALACDLATDDNRPRVVALLQVMQLVGMLVSALVLGYLLQDFSPKRLIQVVQSVALASIVITSIAVWKQEPRNLTLTAPDRDRPKFSEAWKSFALATQPGRLLVTVALGTAAFGMQDVLLEPYGGEVLGLSVGQTTILTALVAAGSLAGFALAARVLLQHGDPCRISAWGVLAGVAAFSCVIVSGAIQAPLLFQAGAVLIGFGSGLFSIGTLTAAMSLARSDASGLAVGAWGAVHATALGLALALGGVLRDLAASMAENGLLPDGVTPAASGYGVVYHLEIALLFAALVALGPLARRYQQTPGLARSKFGLAELPG